MMLDAELIANAANHEVNCVLNGSRPRVEGGHRRQDHGARFSAGGEIAKLDQVQGRLAWHENELAPFL